LSRRNQVIEFAGYDRPMMTVARTMDTPVHGLAT